MASGRLTAKVIHPCVQTLQDTCADALVSGKMDTGGEGKGC